MNFDLESPDMELLDRIQKAEELFKILMDVMIKLRSKSGCPWDREQDHLSIKRNIIEEAYEAAEAIERNDTDSLREELGDILLQVVFHGQIADERGAFKTSDIIRTIIKKLIRRHPHVFGNTRAGTSTEVLSKWEDIKKEERKKEKKDSDSIFSGIPPSLPSLHFAYEIQNRASRLRFDWNDPAGVYEKIMEELEELKKEAVIGNKKNASREIGDLLFSIVNYGRHLGLDVEKSLKESGRRFIRRFKQMEKMAEDKDMDFRNLSLEEKDRLWELAKKNI
jgi:tetrapyrrole methylase family protein / MazG family protein